MSDTLLISNGFRTPPIRGRIQLNRYLKDIRYIDLEHTSKLTEHNAGLLAAYDAVIIYINSPEAVLSEKSEKALSKYVKRGGGLLVLNAAIGSFAGSEAYSNLIGGKPAGTGTVSRYRIEPAAHAKRVFSDLPPFDIRDELRMYELSEKARLQMSVKTGNGEYPVVWTRKKGEGRVCCIAPGATASTLAGFEFRRLLSASLGYILKKSKE